MKIIAANAVPASDNEQKTLQIANDAELAEIAASGALQGVERIELSFPKFTDGRAFSQAVLLRRRYGFTGDIRATGDVLIDQLVQMARSGFTSAVLAEGLSADAAERQFARYSAFYQGDAQEPRPHFAREAA
ncbi:MAG: DUF934 domain-containing protein [Comamonas sp.]|jgi:uncharacterized protein (DUF934 family)|uniref:DUF934 domain-containing protein n=1 Tax=Comamonas sp. TaxID=34028 RepID=UPI0028251230|nr:DUF934 domain-containing protein [Comamonas sp.]MDR0214908.1 DUF934 domain-containing protein [Comamonas sp.]MDR2298615.1 DUF934 domain-containing protein [Comamonas sp.]